MSEAERVSPRRQFAAPLALVASASVIFAGVWLGWERGAFRFVARLFYEQSALAALREPSQLGLVRVHLLILAAMLGIVGLAWGLLGAHGRRWWLALMLAYTIRAAIWIAGSNLPLVPGDSAHYVEVAASILHGEGPVKHYVESFFSDYPRIREGKGVLDDWATPLYSYLLAAAYRVSGIEPGDSIEATFAVSKGVSFALNLLTLPVVYLFARRRFGAELALGAMAVLAVLPVHAVYAGFGLRESLVTLMSVLAFGTLLEAWEARGSAGLALAVASGAFMGLTILSRNTGMAMAAACGVFGLFVDRGRKIPFMLAWGITVLVVIAPWAYATWREYGEPFHTYTKYFPYNFSWAVHHYERGNTRASQFYTLANAPEIARVKVKSLVLVTVYSTMILGVPLMVGFWRSLTRNRDRTTRVVALIAVAFVGGTLASVADVTQVAQLGRYYVPLFVLMIPFSLVGLSDWVKSVPTRRLVAASFVALLWADPSWAYDFSWLGKSYQLHWPALRESGRWVREHPEAVPTSARVMTWFPWEFRLASRRTTVLMNRSLYPPHILRTIRQYGVTHVLWGSFEPPPDIDPESYGANQARTRAALGLFPTDELYRTPDPSPFGTYPVTLYRVGTGLP